MKEISKFKLAEKRNYFKYVLSGMIKPIDIDVLSEEELIYWDHIKELRKYLLDNFDNVSRTKGLKVPEHKCWCGKEGKYQLEDPWPGHGYYVCKKHLE